MSKSATFRLGTITLLLTTGFIFAQVDIHGFVSQGYFHSLENNYLAENSTEGTFSFRELGINFQNELGNRARIGMQFLSREVGVYGQNKITLDWAYGEYQLFDWLRFCAGRVKNQTGFYTDIQDFDFLTPWAILPPAMYDKGIRTLNASVDGVKVLGNIDLKKAGSLEYSYTFGGKNLKKNDDFIEYGNSVGAPFNDATLKNTSVCHLRYYAPLEGLKLNLTWAFLNDLAYNNVPVGGSVTADMQSDLHNLFAGIIYQHSKFDAIAEYNANIIQGKTTIKNHPVMGTFSQASDTTHKQCWYAGVNIKPLEWLNFGGYFQMSWSDTYNNDNDGTNSNKVLDDINDMNNINRDGALTLTFILPGNVLLKTEGHLVKGKANVSSTYNPDGVEDTWQYAVVKATYNF